MRWTPSEVEKFIFPQSVESCQNNHSGSGLILDPFCRYLEPLLGTTVSILKYLNSYLPTDKMHSSTLGYPLQQHHYSLHQTRRIFHQCYVTETSIESEPNLKRTHFSASQEHFLSVLAAEVCRERTKEQ